MAPKKVTKKIVISTIEMKKKLITKWESDTRLSDPATQYSSYYFID
jgi:hypothetical protein